MYHLNGTTFKSQNGINSKVTNILPFYELTETCIPKYAVVILNRPLSDFNKDHLVRLWKNALVRITVDGGTKRWEEFQSTLIQNIRAELESPELVTGDFDSITEDILSIYKSKGCEIVHTPDQNATDFTKALMALNSYCDSNTIHIDSVIVISEVSGRVDHIMANINTLFLCKTKQLLPEDVNVFMLAHNSISWLLQSGEHCIQIPQNLLNHESWCSLVPLGGKCETITTRGLKWNLENESMSFGGMVSTSNTFDGSSHVVICNSHPVLWSMKIIYPNELCPVG